MSTPSGGEGEARGRPAVSGLHEAALYVADLDRAERFWRRLGFEVVGRAGGRHVFLRVGDDVLLLFDPRGTLRGTSVPPHGGLGSGHVALSVPGIRSLDEWRDALRAAGVPIEAEIAWPSRGRSVYFRDPDGNSIEFITVGTWGFPEAP